MKKITVVGSSNTDMSICSAHLPAPGETVIGGEFRMGPGGKGANQAVAARRLGGAVEFICKVGKDLLGDKALEGYSREGIRISHCLRSEKPTGTALILVDADAENCISVAPGANSDFGPSDVEAVADVIRDSSALLLQLELPVESVKRAAEIANGSGVPVILNPAPYCELPDELLKNVSLLVPNKTELSAMSGTEIKDDKTLNDAIDIIHSKGVKNLVVTLGSKGSIVSSVDGRTFIPAIKVKAVDTTAAGDTFCGALAVALSEERSLEQAACFATAASALTVQKRGAQDSIPFRNEIL